MLRFDLITLFPDMFTALCDHGVSGRALRKGLWSFFSWNPRDHADDRHRTIDDRPYGGGPGMVMMAEPLARAVEQARTARRQAANGASADVPVVLLSPAGRIHDQPAARRWADSQGAIVVCGRYEGIDQRFIDTCVDLEISLGDYILSGGELAAMVWMDTIVRLLPGALHDPESAAQESFESGQGGLLDHPHYTRPETWRSRDVPEVLLSGHHENIRHWRQHQASQLTHLRRPDLLPTAKDAARPPVRPPAPKNDT